MKNSEDSMLYVRELKKIFNKGTNVEHIALNGINLEMKTGEFACIVGSNGAGKSTLFNAIAGTVLPDSGLIKIAGENVTFKPEYKRARTMSRVFQDPLKGTAPNLTVAENVALALGRVKASDAFKVAMRPSKRELIHDKLKTLGFGLEDRMNTPVGSLSGGQRQSVTLLMSTIGNPDLLLLDEHTAALDPSATERILQLTKDIVREQNITTLMITHDMQDALDYGTRTLVMHDGKFVADVSGSERSGMNVSDLMDLFAQIAGRSLNDDKMLLK